MDCFSCLTFNKESIIYISVTEKKYELNTMEERSKEKGHSFDEKNTSGITDEQRFICISIGSIQFERLYRFNNCQ